MTDLETEIYSRTSELPQNQWNNVVAQSELGSVFQRTEWLYARRKAFGEPERHIVVSKNGNPVGVFPNFISGIGNTPFKRLTSTTLSYGGPIVSTQESAVLERMMDILSKICRGRVLIHTLSTIDLEFVRYAEFFDRHGYRPRVNACRFILDLRSSWKQLKASMDSSRRRAMEQGLNEDFEIVDEEITEATLHDFYDSYKNVVDRVDGVRLPFAYFEELKDKMPDRIKLFSAFIDGTQRGSLFYLLDKEQSSVHYLHSGVEKAHFEFNSSELIHRHAIRWGRNEGYRYYDFGLTESNFNSGLFKFKEAFGGKAVPVLAWRKGASRPSWMIYKIGQYIDKKGWV